MTEQEQKEFREAKLSAYFAFAAEQGKVNVLLMSNYHATAFEFAWDAAWKARGEYEAARATTAQPGSVWRDSRETEAAELRTKMAALAMKYPTAQPDKAEVVELTVQQLYKAITKWCDSPNRHMLFSRRMALARHLAESLPPQRDDKGAVAALVFALVRAQQFIRNGREFGFIQMPEDPDDGAHLTVQIIDTAIAEAHEAAHAKAGAA